MASVAGVVGLEAPTEDERTMGMLAHLLMAFTGFLGRLVIFCVKQNSRFVRFHSPQALIWHAILPGSDFLFHDGVCCGDDYQFDPSPAGPAQPSAAGVLFFYFFPFIWLGFMGGWVVNVILGVVYAIRANRGEWANVSGVWEVAAAEIRTERREKISTQRA